MVNLRTAVGRIKLQNPVLAASGTCGFGRELADFLDLDCLGGLVSKGLTLMPRLGNKTPRVAETASGMLNSVGLQNPGLDYFLANELPFLEKQQCAVIVNAAGFSPADYVEMAERLDKTSIDAIELNLSCPNVKEGCHSIGTDEKQIEAVVSAVRKVTRKHLWAKLSPNVTDITRMAQAAQAGGADAVVLINTLLGMAIDRKARRPLLRNNTGGLSGPAIKPIALRMVSEVSRQIEIPVVGVGGICSAEDVLEFLIAGASAVQVGTASLVTPTACQDIINDLQALLLADAVENITDYIGTLRLWEE